MASKDDLQEKPNLRPTKRVTASGKTIFLHHIPTRQSTKSYIQAQWAEGSNRNLSGEDVPFDIDQPLVEYSLNKRHRWEILDALRKETGYSSSTEERDIQSDDERTTRKSARHKKNSLGNQPPKYRLYEFHNIRQRANCVTIVSNDAGSNRVQVPRKTYMAGPNLGIGQRIGPAENQDSSNFDVTYYATVPPPRERQLANIRRQHVSRKKKVTSHVQRPESTSAKGNESKLGEKKIVDLDSSDEIDYDDDEDLAMEVLYATHPGQLKLNDFIPPVSKSIPTEHVRKITENLIVLDDRTTTVSKPDGDTKHSKVQFHRQISREEKRFNRDLAIHKKAKNIPTTNNEKAVPYLMSLSFRRILMEKNNLNVDYLSKTYKKNFLHAQCYPNKFLICLTDRVKALNWSEKSDGFAYYTMLDAYLVIVENPSNDTVQPVDIALNMDLNCKKIEIETLVESESLVYSLSEVIERTIKFISTLPFEVFKPIDLALTNKRIKKTFVDADLSDSEHMNKQIDQLKILDKNEKENLQLTDSMILHDYDLVRPDICTICYRDIDESVPVTALKACAHWLCDDCWKNYLEASVKAVQLICCPEWNCRSVVDIGTLISLANVRCMNLYQRNIERHLVNISHSYVKCPSKNCINIVQVIGSMVRYVRCSCGHEFCGDCKREAHFPAQCTANRFYLEELYRSGDAIIDAKEITNVEGRNCISCNDFIEKNGGCNHMTCRCGAEFCWACTGSWKEHTAADGSFRCPKAGVALQEVSLEKQRPSTKRLYLRAVFHRHERLMKNQLSFRNNAKRLLSTIPLEKKEKFHPTFLEKQIHQRESLLAHLNEMAKYIINLHRICEFICVAADGYGNTPCEFRNSLQPLEILVENISQTFEGGRGQKAIENLNDFHQKAEQIIKTLEHFVTIRELRRANTTGYVTS